MPSNDFIGRRTAVGFGFEATAGTAVAPTTWMRLLTPDVQDGATFIDNNSGMGRVEDSDDQALVGQQATAKLNGKVTDLSIGYLLANAFGTWASTLHTGETTIYDATFTVAQTNVPPTLTMAKIDPVESKRYSLATVSDIEIACVAGDWVKHTTTVQSKLGAISTDTAAFVAENEFTSKHVTVKLATNLTGLTGATPIQVKSFKLKLDKKLETYIPLGMIDPSVFNTTAVAVTGEVVLRYNTSTLHDTTFANTPQAMAIQIQNSDVLLGVTAHPTLTLTMPRARLNTWSHTADLDKVIEQTVGFKANLDVTSGYMLTAVLTNTKVAYV
jgi:hypothetical protein